MDIEKIRNEILPYGQQSIDQDDINAVVEVLQSDWLTTGPKIDEFEEKVADYCDAKYAVALSSGTAALHAACYAAGITDGDEVITTPITFAATANSVLYQNGSVVFADINSNTYNIDLNEIENKITSKTKAIIPVDFTGQPVEIDKIMELAAENNLIVIEDAAHSFGAEFKDKKIGSIADMTTFSFHPVKNITSGEGGMVVTDDYEYYKAIKDFRTHGITKNDKEYINESHGPWYHEQQFLGYNYRMTDIQAALGISQLNKIGRFNGRRREIADAYNDAFKDVDAIITPFQKEHVNSSWHLYVIKLKLEVINTDRKKIFEELRKANLGVNIHYIPVYYHPYYQNLGYNKGICPEAEIVYDRIITLPLFPKMTDRDIEDVIEIVTKIISRFT